jgi:hypothetical protein
MFWPAGAKVYDIVKEQRFNSVANIDGVKIKDQYSRKQIEAVGSVDLNFGNKRQYAK